MIIGGRWKGQSRERGPGSGPPVLAEARTMKRCSLDARSGDSAHGRPQEGEKIDWENQCGPTAPGGKGWMEPDDLLCSRNARPQRRPSLDARSGRPTQTALVRRRRRQARKHGTGRGVTAMDGPSSARRNAHDETAARSMRAVKASLATPHWDRRLAGIYGGLIAG